MGFRSIQLTIDDEDHERKKNLGKGITWRKIYRKGLEAYEAEMSKPLKFSTDIYRLQLNSNDPEVKRIFEFEKNGKWVPLLFRDIPIGGIFRMVDNEKVFSQDGISVFKKRGDSHFDNGKYKAEVNILHG